MNFRGELRDPGGSANKYIDEPLRAFNNKTKITFIGFEIIDRYGPGLGQIPNTASDILI